MCLAGGTGVTVEPPAGTAIPSHAFFYGEDQARYLVATGSGDDVLAAARKAGVPAVLLGYSGGASLVVEGLVSLPLPRSGRPTRLGCRPIWSAWNKGL